MSSPVKFLDFVRVWKDGEQWRWAPVDKWAPEDAAIAKRFREGAEEFIDIERDGRHEAVRGALKSG